MFSDSHERTLGQVSNKSEINEFKKNIHLFSYAVSEILGKRKLKGITGHGIGLSQYNLLKLISHKQGQTVGDVSKFLNISYPAATKTVNKLTKLNLVKRNHDPVDRRIIRLELTSEGRMIIDKFEPLHNAYIMKLINLIPSEIRGLFLEILQNCTKELLKEESLVEHICLQCGAYEEIGCVGQGKNFCAYLED